MLFHFRQASDIKAHKAAFRNLYFGSIFRSRLSFFHLKKSYKHVWRGLTSKKSLLKVSGVSRPENKPLQSVRVRLPGPLYHCRTKSVQVYCDFIAIKSFEYLYVRINYTAGIIQTQTLQFSSCVSDRKHSLI